MRGRLERVDGASALRTAAVTGEFAMLPTVGQQLVLIGKSLVPQFPDRVVTTSPVVRVTMVGERFLFATESHSLYRLIVEEDP